MESDKFTNPGPIATATSNGAGLVYSGISYFFAVIGPTSSPVSLTIAGNWSATGSGAAINGTSSYSSMAQVRLTSVGSTFTPVSLDWSCFNGDNPGLQCGLSTYSYTFSATPPSSLTDLSDVSVFQQVLQAQAGAVSASQAFAEVDPHIFISSSLPDPSDYSIVLSPGIGNPAIPESSTWDMMSLGFAGLAFAVVRRSRKAGDEGWNERPASPPDLVNQGYDSQSLPAPAVSNVRDPIAIDARRSHEPTNRGCIFRGGMRLRSRCIGAVAAVG